jgi:hypothetical protein
MNLFFIGKRDFNLILSRRVLLWQPIAAAPFVAEECKVVTPVSVSVTKTAFALDEVAVDQNLSIDAFCLALVSSLCLRPKFSAFNFTRCSNWAAESSRPT